MEFNLLALIGISLSTMFFGYFFGLFEGRGQGYKRGRKEESLSRAQEPPPPAPATQPESAADEPRSLLVLRRDRLGQPSVQVDGQVVAASDVSPTVRKRLIELMVMLRPWIEPPGPAAQAEARMAPGAAPSAPPTRKVTPTTGVVGEAVSPTPAASAAAQGPMALSLVQQIDYVLQARLAGTALASRGIRLAEAPHGGAIVFIGQTQFDGVDKVTDPEIQAAIRSAIAEWEKRYTPG